MTPPSPGRPRQILPAGPLLRLALLRTLTPSFLTLLALLAAFAVTRDWGLSPDALRQVDAPRLERGFARQGVWLLLLLLFVPLLVHRASTGFARRREREWLASQPAGAIRLILPNLLGTWLAALLVLGFTALLAETAAGSGSGSGSGTLRFLHALDHPTCVLFESDEPARWEQPDCDLAELPAGSVVRMRPTVAPGSGPALSIRATAGSSGGAGARGEVRARIFSSTALEIPLPPGGLGPLHLELARESEGAVLLLPDDRIELLVPLADERRIGGEILLRLALASLAWIALGLGLGAWMRPGLASLCVLALWMIPWWWGLGEAWIPGGDLPRVWSLLGEGIAPPLRDAREGIGTATALLLGLGAAGLGFRRGAGA
jgi:hypothetical protein